MIENNIHTAPYEASKVIREKYPNFHPQVGVVLGSGLGQFTRELRETVIINYEEIPGFPRPSAKVKGHKGQMVLGYCGNTAVVCLQGRAHTYEGLHYYDSVKNYVRTLKVLGCNYFVATNAAGSLREEVGPGELMLITDHINLQPSNPLIGPNDDDFGSRFYPLDNAYDATMQEKLRALAADNEIALATGVYLCTTGPHYETAAEIRAFKTLGADAVGMSTVPEVLVANHCGLKVAVISAITNYATGLNKEAHSHDSVLDTAARASENLNILLKNYLRNLA